MYFHTSITQLDVIRILGRDLDEIKEKHFEIFYTDEHYTDIIAEDVIPDRSVFSITVGRYLDYANEAKEMWQENREEYASHYLKTLSKNQLNQKSHALRMKELDECDKRWDKFYDYLKEREQGDFMDAIIISKIPYEDFAKRVYDFWFSAQMRYKDHDLIL